MLLRFFLYFIGGGGGGDFHMNLNGTCHFSGYHFQPKFLNRVTEYKNCPKFLNLIRARLFLQFKGPRDFSEPPPPPMISGTIKASPMKLCTAIAPLKVTPTTFRQKCKNPPKCTKFCSTRKLEVAAKTSVFDKKVSHALANTGS